MQTHTHTHTDVFTKTISRNQARAWFNNDITGKSCEQRLTTKEHIATDTNSNGFYCEMNSQHSITLLFLGSNSRCALLLKAPSISNIDSRCHTYIKKLKSRTCEWFLIACATDTHTDFADENNFKKPGARST